MFSFAPQVRIVDGRIVLNEESLYIRHEPDPSMMHIIHDAGQHVTSATYLARESSDKWNHEETEKFYKVRMNVTRLRRNGRDGHIPLRFPIS